MFRILSGITNCRLFGEGDVLSAKKRKLKGKFGIILLVFMPLIGIAQDFQKIYIEAMRLYDSGDPLKSFHVMDEAISKYTNVPAQFYTKSLFYLKEAYYDNKVGTIFFTNTVQRYYHLLTKMNVTDERIWEEFIRLSDEAGLRSVAENSMKNLLLINPSNRLALYTLVKSLFSEGKYGYVNKVSEKNIEILFDFPEMMYIFLLSKIYSQDYRNIERVLQWVLNSYQDDEVFCIVSGLYYQIMEFRKAWDIENASGKVLNPELRLRLMILMGENDNRILNFTTNYRGSLSRSALNLVSFISRKNTSELQDFLKREILVGDVDSIDTVVLALALSFTNNLPLYNLAMEKAILKLFSKKAYNKVIEYGEKSKPSSKTIKYLLAISYAELGNYRKALKLLEELRRSIRGIDTKISFVHLKLGNYRKALSVARSQVRSVVSGDSDAEKYLLAQVFIEIGDILNARKVLNSVRETNSFYYRMLTANLSFLGGDYQEAEKILEALLDEDSYNPDVMNSLAYVWAKQGKKLSEALSLSKLSLIFEENYNYLDTLAYIHYKLGNLSLAREYIERAVKLMEKERAFNAEVYRNAHDIYKSLGEVGKSKLMLKSAKRRL